MDTAYRVSPLRTDDPERLGDYVLTGRLGSGGMAVVYLAEDPDGTYVAIKLIHASLAHDPEFRARFRGEVDRARLVPSFCTAEVLDADVEHDPPYLVVEYVDGPSLAEVVEQRGPLRAAGLHSLAVGVATALAGIHGAGVIHRDLKPDNVLLAPGSPKVIDFGISRAFEATSQHTRTDQMVGTVAYMAPERFSSEPGTALTAAADVFAWACVVAYAGTGRTPFHGDSPPATAARILTQPPFLEGLPQPLRDVVEVALAKDPADRPTARELLDMLLGDQPVMRPATVTQPAVTPPNPVPVPVPAAPPRQGAPRLIAALVALLVLAGLTIAGLTLTGDDQPAAGPPPSGAGAGTAASAPPARTPDRELQPTRAADNPAGEKPTKPSPGAPGKPKASKPPAPSSKAAPAASANPTGRNLALGRPVTASGSEGVRGSRRTPSTATRAAAGAAGGATRSG
ncbi:hypothetical protein Asp14428_21450 [Actinoplanes sp. NBRC 14428]|nr:hypothetical protein Asp14428_21450 [Actinoplanes sp. NBRC 14428]